MKIKSVKLAAEVLDQIEKLNTHIGHLRGAEIRLIYSDGNYAIINDADGEALRQRLIDRTILEIEHLNEKLVKLGVIL